MSWTKKMFTSSKNYSQLKKCLAIEKMFTFLLKKCTQIQKIFMILNKCWRSQKKFNNLKNVRKNENEKEKKMKIIIKKELEKKKEKMKMKKEILTCHGQIPNAQDLSASYMICYLILVSTTPA